MKSEKDEVISAVEDQKLGDWWINKTRDAGTSIAEGQSIMSR